MATLVRLAMAATLVACATADESHKPSGPPPPAPGLSHACLLKAGPKQNHSMFHEPEFQSILASWGVLIGAPPSPFNMLEPQGAGSGEYYMCQEFPEYDFWSVTVGLPSSGGGGRRRRSSKNGGNDEDDDAELHPMHDLSTNEGYMAAITHTLGSLAQHPVDIGKKRRRMQHHGYGGGGSSVALCLPKECGKQDVKIITGYYYFWLKCGGTIASADGGGGFGRRMQHGGGGPSPAQLEDLLKCGQTTCPWKGEALPSKVPKACREVLYVCEDKKSTKLACEACLFENRKQINAVNCTQADKAAFCVPPPKFNPTHCYYEACPKSEYVTTQPCLLNAKIRHF